MEHNKGCKNSPQYIGKTLEFISIGKNFLNSALDAQFRNSTNDQQVGFYQIKKIPYNRVGKIFLNYSSDRRLVSV